MKITPADSGGRAPAAELPAAGILAVESLAAGLAYGAGLCWAGTCLVASFRPNDLGAPYWRGLSGLRTDTCGIIAFFVVAVTLCTREYLGLRRHRDGLGERGRRGQPPPGRPAALLAQAISQTVAILATGLVVYLSVNAVTHPATLAIRATHLSAWPTEGTLRVIALLLCTGSVAALRYLRAGRRGRFPVALYGPG